MSININIPGWPDVKEKLDRMMYADNTFFRKGFVDCYEWMVAELESQRPAVLREVAEDEPVLLIRDKGGVLTVVGHPTSFKGSELMKYLQEGATFESTTITEYRRRELKLYQVN